MHRHARHFASFLLTFSLLSLHAQEADHTVNFDTTWYAPTAAAMRKQIKNSFLKARSTLGRLPTFSQAQGIRALVVPHANTPEAADRAALAYARVSAPQNIKRIILIAPGTGSHRGASTLLAKAYHTPLGPIPIDTAAQQHLVTTSGVAATDTTPDTQHHLAHQLPLIQHHFTNATLLPLIASNLNEYTVFDLCYLLRTVVDQHSLIIFSSDAADRQNANLGGGVLNIIEATEETQLWGPAFVESLTPSNKPEHLTAAIRTLAFSSTEQLQLLTRARIRLNDAVSKGAQASSLPLPAAGMFHQPFGLFVSLHAIADDGTTRLRGCMGNLSASHPLHQTLDRLVAKAALNDPRFTPVTTEELKSLKISLSVMLPTRPIHHPDQIQLGRHGIALNCNGMHSIFLPEVARHRQWDTETLLNNLCLKAGLPSNSWRRTDCTLEVFETITMEEER